MADSSSSKAAAFNNNASDNDIRCCACGKSGVEFSNRQRNKALFQGDPARCKSCIEADTPLKKPESSKPEQKENEQNGRLYFSDGESVSGESEIPDNQEVSLNALKEQILGRKLNTREDVSDTQEDSLMLPAIENAADLRKDLSCAICQEPFWQPLSLSCGHSFCQDCLKWWLKHHSKQPHRASHGTCPTCREELVCCGESLQVNTALRACVTALYGEELSQRDQAAKLAKIKATAGENGGAHDRGFEVVSGVGAWKRLNGVQDNGFLYARRSIVLDDQDARMQLALAVDGLPGASPPTLVEGKQYLQVSLCLLTMEEDEAEDGGFPLVLKDEDDEHLISNNGRFNSIIRASLVGTDDSQSSNVAETIGADGTATFKVPLEPEFFGTACIRFVHEECGAVYEIRFSNENLSEGREASVQDNALVEDAARDRNTVFMEDEIDHGPNEYEDDGFLVMNDEEVEESASESEGENDEEDVCCVCREHGELIICDGGEHLEGCGKSFHIHCVQREHVPPGDWICGDCASTIDLDVGLVGHEFTADGENARKSSKRVLEESSGDESDGSIEVLAQVSKNKTKADAKKRSRILESDSDDE